MKLCLPFIASVIFFSVGGATRQRFGDSFRKNFPTEDEQNQDPLRVMPFRVDGTRASKWSSAPSVTNSSITVKRTLSSAQCGCLDCTVSILNTLAGDYTCGARIQHLMNEQSHTEEQACIRVARTEFPAICGPACDPGRCDPILVEQVDITRPDRWASAENPFSPDPAQARASNPSSLRCGCNRCTSDIWNADAGGTSCGERIEFLQLDTDKYPTEESACRQVAFEFPLICGSGCSPDRCNNRETVSSPRTSLYCFPEYDARTRFEGVWGNYIVEVKEGTSCGPGDNKFTTNTVSRNGDEIKLSFKRVGGRWAGSEVRVVLPEDEMPFDYGKYSFSVKSIEVVESGSVVDTVLPQSLVLGLFTWDDTENFDIRENYNHEVDIEISRWNIPGNADGQFLVQPYGSPQMHRFFTGEGDTYDQAPHVYEFDWNPADIAWSTDAGGGLVRSYSTQSALFANSPDYIQCLPADVEVRLNLWNLFGSVTPVGMKNNQQVEVVIDNFSYTPSGLTGVPNGGTCTKDCQCGPSSECQGYFCIPAGRRLSKMDHVVQDKKNDDSISPYSSVPGVVVGCVSILVTIAFLTHFRSKGKDNTSSTVRRVLGHGQDDSS